VTNTQAPITGNRVALGAVFASAAWRYWTGVFPRTCRELRHSRQRAGEIPDPVLRQLAFDAQRKRGNLEGAAAFATFAPRRSRAAAVRALVAFQSAYNYLDLLAEQPRAEAIVGGRRLHEALLAALDPAAPRLDYYAYYPQREDNGYLDELIGTCRTALATLPSYASVAAAASRSAERIVEFQSLNLSESQGDHDTLAQWARAETPAGTGLQWWEAAAAGGSSLGVFALIAAAAGPVVSSEEQEQIENAYFPWIGALHSLLDHLVDTSEDAACGQRSLVGYYASPAEAAERMQMLAAEALRAARALPQGRRHAVILAGMAGYYLSAPEASAPRALPVTEKVRETIGRLMGPALLVFKARRLAGRLAALTGSPSGKRRAVRSAPAATQPRV
jgi:tetraprenyl-beta-curcumene synthase